ncbi:oxidoreductase family protein [Mrakia frigida]|uniref:Gfo/Idh/MocA family protein n=1 Tax=Mrakia frigida TaxID=29902 RepID=UPI003FCC1A7C
MTSSQQPLAPTGIAILGAGLFPKLAYLPSLLPHSSLVSLKAIYSRSTSSATSLAQEASEQLPGFKVEDVGIYSDDGEEGLDALLKREDVEAVLIALPIPQIPEAILKVLEAGKHVLSEKPIAKDIETAKALIKTYNEKYAPKGLIWRVAENWEMEPVFLAAKKVLASKEQGELRSFAWNNSSRTEEGSRWISTSWRTVPTYQGGFILDGGVHSAAALRLLLPSPPSTLVAHASLTLPHLAPTDTLTSLLTLSSGVIGTFYLTFAAPKNKPVTQPLFEAASEKGWLEIHQVQGEGFVLKVFGEDGELVGGKEDKFGNEGVEGEFGSFFRRVRGGEAEEDGVGRPEEVLKDLVLIESGLKSEGRKVDLIELARV